MSKPEDIIVFDTETTGKNPHTVDLLGVSLCYDGVSSFLTENVTLPDGKLVAHNGKYDAIVLARHGLPVPKIYFDTMIAGFLLFPDVPKKLEKQLLHWFSLEKEDLLDVFNRVNSDCKPRSTLPEGWYKDAYTATGKKKHSGIPLPILAQYAKEDAEGTKQLYTLFNKNLKGHLRSWFFDVEMPLLNILVQSELTGVKIDVPSLRTVRELYGQKRLGYEKDLRSIAGVDDLNLNSPDQLRKIIYDKFRLRPPFYTKGTSRFPKGQPSVDRDAIERLAKNNAFCKLYRNWKEIDHILNAFTDSLLEKLDKNDILHATFNQCGTVTRRMSCKDPNLQQIPSKGELGKSIRSCFIPRSKDKTFIIADYSQIEPRLLTHFSQEPKLLQCYKSSGDIYTTVGDPLGLTRAESKIFFLSLMYGKTKWGLAKDFKCTLTEAQEIINKFFFTFPQVNDYIKEVQEEAKRNNGFLSSIAGLPLYLGDTNTSNKWEFEALMREAVNYPIQASSQDIMKKAIVKIYNKMNLAPVLMVHDELVYEVDREKAEDYLGRILYHMETAWELSVPLIVEAHIADHWTKE